VLHGIWWLHYRRGGSWDLRLTTPKELPFKFGYIHSITVTLRL
jgi:hypothetical protein